MNEGRSKRAQDREKIRRDAIAASHAARDKSDGPATVEEQLAHLTLAVCNLGATLDADRHEDL